MQTYQKKLSALAAAAALLAGIGASVAATTETYSDPNTGAVTTVTTKKSLGLTDTDGAPVNQINPSPSAEVITTKTTMPVSTVQSSATVTSTVNAPAPADTTMAPAPVADDTSAAPVPAPRADRN